MTLKEIGDWYFNSWAWLYIPGLQGYLLARFTESGLPVALAAALGIGGMMLIFTLL